MTDDILLEGFEPTTDEIRFKMFTGLLKAYEDDNGAKIIRGVASSTIEDHNGDEIKRTAIDDMVAAANDNMTIFLNHEYKVPEDVAGSVRNAHAALAGMGETGEIWDMNYDVAVDESNPRAVQTYKSIKNGVKLGLSIGAKIPPGGAVINKKTGRAIFNHLELLETSIVGLPANPRSWISSVVKALRSPNEDDNGLMIAGVLTTTDSGDSTVTITQGSDEDSVFTGDDLPGQQPEEPHTTDPDPSDEDGEDGSQGASESEPETEPASETVTESVDSTAALTLTLSSALEVTTKELLAARQELGTITRERDEAISQRDDALSLATKVLEQTASVIERLADTPVGRKAVLRDAQDDFAQLDRLYSPALLKLMRGEHVRGNS